MKKIITLLILIAFTIGLRAQAPAKYWVQFKDKEYATGFHVCDV